MEVSLNKNGVLKFSYQLKKSETFKVNKSKKFYTVSIYKRPDIIKGVASVTASNRECLFIDYDDCSRWVIEQDYRLLQEKYPIPEGYLFSTKKRRENGQIIGNFHIICIATFNPRKIYEMLSETHCDVNYVSSPRRNIYRRYILRIGPKPKRKSPKFEGMIGLEKNYKGEVSTAHKELLSKLYPKIKHPNYCNEDGLKEIKFQVYETLKG